MHKLATAMVSVSFALSAAAAQTAAQAAVPATTPFVTATGGTAMRLCYFAQNPDPTTAKATTCRDSHLSAAVQAVIRELNGLADGNHGQGTCVRDNNSEVRLVLGYRDGHRERVDVHFSSCQFAEHAGHLSKQSTRAVRQDVARRAGFTGNVP
ncbi:MAG: hypothetical protein NVSMB55_12820 [Mycobacteriales bacterium]